MKTASAATAKRNHAPAVLSTLQRDARIREWMGLFHRATGLAIRLVSPDLQLSEMNASGHEHRFCHEAGVRGSEVCCQTRQALVQKLRGNMAPQMVVCGTGLAEVAVPLVVDGRHLATFLVGQVFGEKPDAASWARLRALMGNGTDPKRLAQLRTAYLNGQVLPKDTMNPLIHMVSLHGRRLMDGLKPAPAVAQPKAKRPAKPVRRAKK